MRLHNKFLLIAIILLVSGVLCLYNMNINNTIAALGGGLTMNGFTALYGYFKLR